ncbi:MAG: hypothetical protein KAR06_02350 [Deltaproteobacteria bacterium]|nr:hypothetical protein [Deltaproteobacteria bacterium]
MDEQINEIDETSMRLFAGCNNSFHVNDWIAWEMACLDQERIIPPSEFKIWKEHRKRAYLKNSGIVGHA